MSAAHPERRAFADAEALAAALAEATADALRAGIALRGQASLLVSGGSTPKRFFGALSSAEIDWRKVFVSLVDERWVPPDSERSNARLVADNLLTGPASAAQFIPLYVAGTSAAEAVPDLTRIAKELPRPFDMVILGMGNDGHTASFFPGGDRLADAIDQHGSAVFSSMRAAGAGEERITFTLPALLETKNLVLHIEGAAKADTLATALADGPVEDMPVRAVLRQNSVPLTVYWCP